MTEGERTSLLTIEKYHGTVTLKDMCAKLGEEFAELAVALAPAYEKPPKPLNEKQILEARGEIGDCAFILLHMLHRLHQMGAPEPSLTAEVWMSAEKMEGRGGIGYFRKYMNRGREELRKELKICPEGCTSAAGSGDYGPCAHGFVPAMS